MLEKIEDNRINYYPDNGQIELRNLSMHMVGCEHCKAGHSFGPIRRTIHVIHFIIDGYGEFSSDAGLHTLSRGQAFYIAPGDVVYYKASSVEPWSYFWVSFVDPSIGNLMEKCGLTSDSPIYRQELPEEFYKISDRLVNALWRGEDDMLLYHGCIFLLLSYMQAAYRSNNENRKNSNSTNLLVEKAKHHITDNTFRSFTVAELCDILCVSRTYLYKLFMDHLGMPPSQYITQMRLHAAISMLIDGGKSIRQIVEELGYYDASQFCRQFKQYTNMTPNEYKKAVLTGFDLRIL